MQNFIYILFLSFLFYLLGSLPFAYLIVKKKSNKDLTLEGSGNTGTLNAVKVTKSKFVGILVLLLDFSKGFIPLLIFDRIFLTPANLLIIPSVFLIIGHNYSVFIKFKGGRGLATSAGMFSFISFPVVIVWGIFWILFRFARRGTLFANFFATLLYIFPVYYFRNIFSNYTLFINPMANFDNSLITLAVITIFILIKHFEIFAQLNILPLKKES